VTRSVVCRKINRQTETQTEYMFLLLPFLFFMNTTEKKKERTKTDRQTDRQRDMQNHGRHNGRRHLCSAPLTLNCLISLIFFLLPPPTTCTQMVISSFHPSRHSPVHPATRSSTRPSGNWMPRPKHLRAPLQARKKKLCLHCVTPSKYEDPGKICLTACQPANGNEKENVCRNCVPSGK